MPTIEPMDVPEDPAAQRAEKNRRIAEVEGQPHPTDRRDGPSADVERAITPEVDDR